MEIGDRLWTVLHRARRALAPLAHLRPAVIYHPDYSQSVSGVPLDALRADRILSFLLEQKLLRERDVATPRPATLEALLRVHEPGYLRSLEDPAVVGSILGVPVTPEQVRLAVSLQRLIVGGTVRAAYLALRAGGPAIHLAGGLHHARPDRGMGFCLLNDVAVAIRSVRAHGFSGRVVVVDLDLHDGNGTRAAFRQDDTVHTLSIHNADWDDDDAASTTRLALGSGVEDARYLAAVRDTLPAVLERHRPGLVVYIAGVDPAADDALGDWQITPAGMLARDRFVVETCRAGNPDLPMVIVLGGGYGGSAWRHYARFFGWLLSGRVPEPADAITLARHRLAEIREAVAPPPARDGDWLDWSFGEEDVASAVGTTAEPRLLQRYSRQEVAALLERAGVMGQLRARAFADPVVEIHGSIGLGDTIRVWSSPAREDLLLELRLGRNRRLVPGAELLWVEWLLLQNPRATFTPGRPPLPGQEHPGLGVLPDIVALLVAIAGDLHLDGVAFRSSQFHVAALVRDHLRFLEPGMAAQVAAVEAATPGWSLARRARAVREGRIIDDATGRPLEWPQVCMILPLRSALRARLDAAGREPPSGPAPRFRVATTSAP